MEYSEVKKYLQEKGLRHDQYCVSEETQNVEFFIDRAYFCSVGQWDNESHEVFESNHGAQVSEDGNEYLTDGELWQFKVYKSLKRAIDFAIECLKSNKLPGNAIRKW